MARLWRNRPETPEGKYPILLRRDGTPVEKPFFSILAGDKAGAAALRAYADKAQELGYDPEMVADVRGLADQYERYTQGHSDPDAPPHRKDNPIVILWAQDIIRRNRRSIGS